MNDIHARAKKGIKLLMGRQVIVQALTFGGGVVLARTLMPAQVGLYAIVTFLVSLFALLGDFGLAPSFIQRKADITDTDLRVALTLQAIITSVVIAVLWTAAPVIVHFYPKAPAGMVWLVRALAFSLIFTTMRSISSLQLERHLRYEKLAVIEVVEALSFQGLAVGLALAGFGVWSFVWAALTRGALGALLAYLAAPWPIRFGFDRETARNILRFGVQFQMSYLASAAGSWITPILVGGHIGATAVAFLTWGSSNGKKPLMLVENIVRVTFPHFSRVQDDPELVESLLIRYLNLLAVPAGLWMTLIIVAGHQAVPWIYKPKWSPAVPALMLYSISMFFQVGTWMAGTVLNSIGQIKYNTRMILMRSCIQLAVSIPLLFAIGFIAMPITDIVVEAVALPLTLMGIGKGTALRVLGALSWILLPIAAGLSAGWAANLLRLSLGWSTVVVSAIAALAYGAMVLLTGPREVKEQIGKKWDSIRRTPKLQSDTRLPNERQSEIG